MPTPPDLVAEELRSAASPPLPGLPTPGEAAAQERLQRWVATDLAAYDSGRELLDGSGTSGLGADLHFGTLSPLQVEVAAGELGAEAEAFTRQLAWRELYQHHLHHQATAPRPASPLESAFRSESDDPQAVAAWREGRTGIPTVDAAMRQLSATGWMSNRARLITASFLTRHLLMDWRIGERHFMAHLIDGDVANNRGRFYPSYTNLRNYAFFFDNAVFTTPRTVPGKFGAHASKLFEILNKGHYDVKLSDEEMHRIIQHCGPGQFLRAYAFRPLRHIGGLRPGGRIFGGGRCGVDNTIPAFTRRAVI